MNTQKLLQALDDDRNESLIQFTTEKMRRMTLDVLKELGLPREETLALFQKLKDYKYVDELTDLKYGTYLRWIPLEDPSHLALTKGALFCEVKMINQGTFCVCKNYGFSKRHFLLSMDKNLIFQRLTEQERVLLQALDHLAT